MPLLKTADVRSYRDLIAWQKSMALVTAVYTCTREFPKSELYGLAAQLRRAAVSVPSNIAEGQGRLSTGEFKQFLGYARGSLLEVELRYLPRSPWDIFDRRRASNCSNFQLKSAGFCMACSQPCRIVSIEERRDHKLATPSHSSLVTVHLPLVRASSTARRSAWALLIDS